MSDEFKHVFGTKYDSDVIGVDHKWEKRDGENIPILNMTDNHILNSLKFVRRKMNPIRLSANGDLYSSDTESKLLLKVAGENLAKKFGQCMAHMRAITLSPKYKGLWTEATKRGILDDK